MNERIIRLDIVDNDTSSVEAMQGTFYLLNPNEEKLEKLKQKIENRFLDHENGIKNPFIDNFSAIIDFIEHNFTTINVEKILVLW